MAHIQFTDELVREYLLFRGFAGALKAFDADLKLDKDKGFRVDRIVDQLLQHIYNYDLPGLRESWNHLDTRLFLRLEQHFTPSVRKLENSVLKFYLVNASENKKQDKITEFFTSLTADLLGQNDWKEWFVFPFIKNPEEHPTFGVYFSRQWQDNLLVSLHNFLAAVYQSMPQPTLSNFEENAVRMAALQKENEIIRKGLINLMNNERKVLGSEADSTLEFESIMDDFFNIAQEIRANENQANLLRTIIRNIGSMPTSPKMESKDQLTRTSHRKYSVKKAPQTKRSLSIDARPTHLKQRERDSSLDVTSTRGCSAKDSSFRREETQPEKQEGNFLFLSREEYSEHNCHITSIKFNSQGNLVASADKEGNLKVWSVSPVCKTITSFSSKNPITCLDWVPNHERYIICGTNHGFISLYDTKDIKSKWSITMESENTTFGKGVVDIVSSPVDPTAVAVLNGKLFVIDLRSRKVEKSLNVPGEATCVKMNHNGQLVMIGTQEGSVVLLDFRKNDIIEKWSNHHHPIIQLEMTVDYTHVYTLARDRICCRPVYPKGKVVNINVTEEMKVHPEIHGRLCCLDNTGTLLLSVGINSGVIYKVSDTGLIKCLELGGHKTMLTCVDWSFANQCATCVTASQDGKIKVSTLLVNSFG
ncbi:hypothetical protein RUM43_012785 [Polyplax serrata]|uniref:WD repeat-containing protein 91 n=1 Tax=Polyplax serrata TaxID=468196 RepID=A0AAN8S430_POLSC